MLTLMLLGAAQIHKDNHDPDSTCPCKDSLTKALIYQVAKAFVELLHLDVDLSGLRCCDCEPNF